MTYTESIMESSSEPEMIPASSNSSNVLMNAVRRTLGMVGAAVIGVVCIVVAVRVGMELVRSVPACLYRSMEQPMMALGCTVMYLLAVLAVAALGVMLLTILYRLVKRLAITKWHLMTCLMLAVVAVVLIYGVLPGFAEFTEWSLEGLAEMLVRYYR